MRKNSGYERCRNRRKEKTAANVSDDRKRKYTVEVEVVRVKITLACTECKQRNYNMTKEKKNHPDRMEKIIRTEWKQRNIVSSARDTQCTKRPNNFGKR